MGETSSQPPAVEPSAVEPPGRGTVFLDLRKSEQALAEENQRLAVVQRVLKLNSGEYVITIVIFL